jgi:hypothetical protein
LLDKRIRNGGTKALTWYEIFSIVNCFIDNIRLAMKLVVSYTEQGIVDEEDIPAAQPEKKENARLSQENEYEER